MGDLNAFDGGRPIKILYVQNKGKPEYELDTGFINVINVFRKLFNFQLPAANRMAALDLSTASLSDQRNWVAIYLEEFFKIINPHRMYEINTDRLSVGMQQGQLEMFGAVDVTVKDQRNIYLFSFTIKQEPGNGQLTKLSSNTGNKKQEPLVLAPKRFPDNTSLKGSVAKI